MVSAMPERYPYVEEDHLEVCALILLICAADCGISQRMAGQTIAGVMSSSDYFVAAAATVAAALGFLVPRQKRCAR